MSPHGDDGFAARVPLLHVAQARGRLGQRVGPADDGRELPVLDQPGHGEQLLPALPGRERAQPLRDERAGHHRPHDAGDGPEHMPRASRRR